MVAPALAGWRQPLQGRVSVGRRDAAGEAALEGSLALVPGERAVFRPGEPGIEKSSDEEVAVEITALQTRLQATYQTTSLISQLSLVNYIK